MKFIKMQKKIFLSLFIPGVLLFLVCSCKKESATDPNQTLIAQMKAVTDSIVKNTHVPGVVALVVDHKRGIDWLYTAGISDIINKLPVDGSYIFRVGSNTKTMVGTVLLQLVDEGKLTLNDKLSKYYPAYPRSDTITIAMLCNMTSGIFNFFEDEGFQNALAANPARVWAPQECIDAGISHDLYFRPGTGWHYSNTSTFILGLLIEQLTGNSLQTEINNRIITPLGLVNTGLLTSGIALPGNHGRGYYCGTYSEGLDMTEVIDASVFWAGGSAYSTPRELQKYVEKLVGGGFLSDTLQHRRLNEMFVANSMFGYYGLCLSHRGSFYGNYGDQPGFISSMYHSNEKNCTVIIYFNSQLELKTEFLFKRFMDILYGTNF